jgi:hypothetical protein
VEPDYTIGFEKDEITPYAHVQNENIECEVEPEEINLRSFRVRDTLENHIWDEDGCLDLRVRRALMDIADDFWETCNIRWVKPKTVLLTGSICNYNWSEYSDVDLHVVVDFGKVHERKDFVQEYFDDKKNEWNNSHEKLTVYGFPVELYVEDIGADTVSSGVYDLWNNEWVREPEKGNIKPIQLNKYAIKQISSEIMTEIDDLCDTFDNEDDKHRIEEIGEVSDKLLKKIKAVRKAGLKKGEMGTGNLVYKVLRRSGYLDKLWKLMEDIYDKLNSVGEDNSFVEKITATF